MKKVINGKLYNTETAKKIGEWDNGIYGNDFSRCEETLYLTKSGAYFLHGDGGPMSKYSESHGNNSWGGGSLIQPMSPQAAREWAEENLDGDDYISAFGEPDEASDNKTPLNLTVSAEFKNKLIKLREDTGKSISQIIEDSFC